VELWTTDQTLLLHSAQWCHLCFIARYHVIKKHYCLQISFYWQKLQYWLNCRNILTTSLHSFQSSLSPSMHIHNYKNILLLGDRISVLRLIYDVAIYSLSNKLHCVCTDNNHTQGTDIHTPLLHHSQHEIIWPISRNYLKVISISETIS